MINFLLALGVYTFLFVLLYISVRSGFAFGIARGHATSNHLGIVRVAEGTVFAFLGLLIAFTFAGSYDRFEIRKWKIIEEINAIEEAYNYVSLLKPALQPNMRNAIKQYANERVATYGRIAEFRGFDEEVEKFRKAQDALWAEVVTATNDTNNTATTLLFAQSVSKMFDVGSTRFLITRIHPPEPIFVLLIGLAALSAFLTGYSMAKNHEFSFIYAVFFVAITAFTIYVIIDLEFPRMGMIRIDSFDHLLVQAKNDLA